MNCQEVRELCSEYVDHRLSPMKIALFEEHLKACLSCSQAVEGMRKTVSLIGSLDEIDASLDFLTQVHRKIKRGNRKGHPWAWFLEPMRVKVPLELAALLVVSVIGLYLYQKSPEVAKERVLQGPADSLPVGRDHKAQVSSAKEREKQRGSYEIAKKKSEPRVKEEEQPSRLGALEKLKEAREETVVMTRRPEVFEIFVEDGALFERKVNILLERVSGKLLAQERSSGPGFLLTLEVPQSRRTEFLTALKQEEKSEAGAIGMDQLAANEKVHRGKAASALESSLRVDEPMVRLHLRILPKK
jgi:hypothetical protein